MSTILRHDSSLAARPSKIDSRSPVHGQGGGRVARIFVECGSRLCELSGLRLVGVQEVFHLTIAHPFRLLGLHAEPVQDETLACSIDRELLDAQHAQPRVDVVDADELHDLVRRGVVADPHHEERQILDRERDSRSSILSDLTAPQMDIACFQENHLFQSMLSPIDLIEELDENCDLERRGHRKALRSIDFHRLARLEVFDGNAHLPIDILDDLRDSRSEPLERWLREQ